jgi:hypothetical protein
MGYAATHDVLFGSNQPMPAETMLSLGRLSLNRLGATLQRSWQVQVLCAPPMCPVSTASPGCRLRRYSPRRNVARERSRFGRRRPEPGIDFGLCLFDITDPTAPLELPNVRAPFFAWGVDIWGDLALVADGHGLLEVVKLTCAP